MFSVWTGHNEFHICKGLLRFLFCLAWTGFVWSLTFSVWIGQNDHIFRKYLSLQSQGITLASVVHSLEQLLFGRWCFSLDGTYNNIKCGLMGFGAWLASDIRCGKFFFLLQGSQGIVLEIVRASHHFSDVHDLFWTGIPTRAMGFSSLLMCIISNFKLRKRTWNQRQTLPVTILTHVSMVGFDIGFRFSFLNFEFGMIHMITEVRSGFVVMTTEFGCRLGVEIGNGCWWISRTFDECTPN